MSGEDHSAESGKILFQFLFLFFLLADGAKLIFNSPLNLLTLLDVSVIRQ